MARRALTLVGMHRENAARKKRAAGVTRGGLCFTAASGSTREDEVGMGFNEGPRNRSCIYLP